MPRELRYKISEAALRHIYEGHKDLVELIGAKSMAELKEILKRVLENPDESYTDRYRGDVKYYLRRLNDLWITAILVGDSLKTAYLIGSRSYRRFRERRWR